MSLFESASLVVTPNGTKASKLYSVKPTDGSGDMTVVRATTATRVNSSGLIESSAINVPRLDYTGSTCPSLLVEPQRTNLVTYSKEFDNAAWTKTNGSITANNTTSPDGTVDADKFIPSSGLEGILQQNHSITSSQTISISTFAKAGELNIITLNSRDNSSAANAADISFNLTAGIISTAASSKGAYTAASGTITNYGNGWYRLTLTHTTSISTTTRVRFITDSSGDGTKGLFVWGAQVEAGANATSYIPTTTASVTRNADVISKTGISSLIGQTEGTLFVDVNYQAESILKTYLNLGTSTSNSISIVARSNNKIGMEVLNSGVQVNASSTSTYSTSQRLKIAMTYKENDFKLYVNGVLQATDTSGTVPAKAEVYLGSYGNVTYQATDGINLAALWKTALTDTELATLTTL